MLRKRTRVSERMFETQDYSETTSAGKSTPSKRMHSRTPQRSCTWGTESMPWLHLHLLAEIDGFEALLSPNDNQADECGWTRNSTSICRHQRCDPCGQTVTVNQRNRFKWPDFRANAKGRRPKSPPTRLLRCFTIGSRIRIHRMHARSEITTPLRGNHGWSATKSCLREP